jgi:hypothetical protein
MAKISRPIRNKVGPSREDAEMMKRTLRTAIAGTLPLLLAAALPDASAAELKSYDASKPSFWANPPPDWFLGDETEAQKGLAPPSGPATPTPLAEL